jgi:hypothetical protein
MGLIGIVDSVRRSKLTEVLKASFDEFDVSLGVADAQEAGKDFRWPKDGRGGVSERFRELGFSITRLAEEAFVSAGSKRLTGKNVEAMMALDIDPSVESEADWKRCQRSKRERSTHVDSPTDEDLLAAARAVEAMGEQNPVSPFSKAPPNSQGAGAAKIQAQGYEVTRHRQSPPRGAPYPTSGPQ